MSQRTAPGNTGVAGGMGMNSPYSAIAGRIFERESQRPIHGLLVSVVATFGSQWEKDDDCSFHCGCDLTNRGGLFWLRVGACSFTEACRCKGNLHFRIEVFDRDGRRILSEWRKADD